NLSMWRHALSLQFRTYMMAYNLLHPETPVLGAIANEVIAHSKMELLDKNGAPHSFRSFFVEAPNEMQTRAVLAWLPKQAAYLASGEVNLNSCVGATVCHHYKNGACFQL
ncbi:MAG TPA: hypothetical protein VHL10_00205, partial [Nitrososphaera sp.]|nr:hypothetical protein [Nitrososphaera sp.]